MRQHACVREYRTKMEVEASQMREGLMRLSKATTRNRALAVPAVAENLLEVERGRRVDARWYNRR